MFHFDGCSRTVNFNREEIKKLAQEIVKTGRVLELRSGHHFLWKECYDTLLKSGEREVIAKKEIGKRSDVYEGKDTLIGESKRRKNKTGEYFTRSNKGIV